MSKESDKLELFFPYYVNQGRLLDIYAILNGGYSEYEEITTAISTEKANGVRAETGGSVGFKLFKLGGTVSADSTKTSANNNENKAKKVQTVTSMLSLVKNTLQSRGYFKEVTESSPGQFVCLPVVLSLNSIKSLLTEMSDILKLADGMQKMGVTVKCAGKKNGIENALKSIQVMFNGEEVLYETEEYAVIGNIVDTHLYQAVRADIIGVDLMCLAQVKRVFPNGAELMRNTIFTRTKDTSAKQKFIEAMNPIVDGNLFDFEAVAIPSIQGKPVYQLEIIALYQGE